MALASKDRQAQMVDLIGRMQSIQQSISESSWPPPGEVIEELKILGNEYSQLVQELADESQPVDTE